MRWTEAFRAAQRKADRELAGFDAAEKEFNKLRKQAMKEIPKRPSEADYDFLRVEHEHAVSVAMWETLEDFAGYDCYNYDKNLNPVACGTCVGCKARETLKRIEDSGWTP